VSEEYQYNTYEEAMEAIKEGRTLEEVRPDLITPELAMIAVKDWVYDLEYVPAHCQTPEMALMVVEEDGSLIEFVRPDLQTIKLALIAVKDLGWNLEFVPAHLQTQEVIEAALEQDPDAKQYIKVKEMFKNALEEALSE
jgi:hypothetical protein